ncbi:TPA: flagellar M-ring protein FliF [Burkholderia cenocepacia]|uniref:flagellar basal-body MS-ring/collar protein FliF n=1 Tax=unclassified Burkholderia TaxID=2613784 RepID=UPI00158E7B13|nr:MULTISPECIES: flagellar basal-body MS-ring/collar protein FliF [unclassified Burkholderia]HEF5875116.1 flagellar M-ring protein FliF [Burkholderia cenocepacia]
MKRSISRVGAYFRAGSRTRQYALAGALTTVVGCAGLAGWLTLRPSYQVLVRDLKPQDAAAVAAQLDKEKVPFRYDERTASILVPADDARAARVKLTSADLRLQGVVGFELFNQSDFGLTEFAQKVNYQRALQGELARTIATLDAIELARVHLSLPETSLFRRDRNRPKASVALFVRDGHALEPDVVKGIQRLVAASVPEMSAADVSVLDQRGASADARGIDFDDPKFALKSAVEQRYERKILAQIATIAGTGRATVSVDASLDFDQIRTTRESGLTQSTAAVGSTPGESIQRAAAGWPSAGLPPLPGAQTAPAAPEAARSERNVEQIVRSPGAIRKLSVGIVLGGDMAPERTARLRDIVSASIGLDPSRGDTLAVYVSDAVAEPTHGPAVPPSAPASGTVAHGENGPGMSPASAPQSAQRHRLRFVGLDNAQPYVPIAAGVALCIVVAWATRRRIAGRLAPPRRLSDIQRAEYAARLRRLLAEPGKSPEDRHDAR